MGGFSSTNGFGYSSVTTSSRVCPVWWFVRMMADSSSLLLPSGSSLACVASVSVEQRAKKRDFRRFARAKNGARAKIRRRGWGRGRKETLAAKHCDFENRPLGLSCLTDFTLSSSIQVAFVILVLARFEILDHLIFPSNKNHTRLP